MVDFGFWMVPAVSMGTSRHFHNSTNIFAKTSSRHFCLAAFFSFAFAFAAVRRPPASAPPAAAGRSSSMTP
jgi:hypothetical protein